MGNAIRVRDVTESFLATVSPPKKEPSTLRYYKGRLIFLDRMLGNVKLSKLTKDDMEKWLEEVNQWPDGNPKAPDTIRANITSLQRWQDHAVEKGFLKAKLMTEFEKPAGRSRHFFPTPEQAEAIKAEGSPEFCMIYEALRRCGARPSELCGATVKDWDRENKEIVLWKHKTSKKVGKPRRITVATQLEEILIQSLGDRTEGPLFLSPRGRQWTASSLSATHRRARNTAGVDKKIVLYGTRHEHGQKVFDAFGGEAAADALGHDSTQMVYKNYARIAPSKRREIQESLSLARQATEVT